MYISDGHGIGAPTVYTIQYLALAAAMYLSAMTQGLPATRCIAKFVLHAIPGRHRKLSNLHKDHHYLLQSLTKRYTVALINRSVSVRI